MLQCMFRYQGIVVSAVCDINPKAAKATDKLGRTALHLAALGGHEAIVELLADNKADLNARDNDSRYAGVMTTSKHLSTICIKGLNIDMAMCIYQLHGAQFSLRSNLAHYKSL